MAGRPVDCVVVAAAADTGAEEDGLGRLLASFWELVAEGEVDKVDTVLNLEEDLKDTKFKIFFSRASCFLRASSSVGIRNDIVKRSGYALWFSRFHNKSFSISIQSTKT